jgi:hypothetical protein
LDILKIRGLLPFSGVIRTEVARANASAQSAFVRFVKSCFVQQANETIQVVM